MGGPDRTNLDGGGAPAVTNSQRRALGTIAGSQLLALTLWFSASAVAPQLEQEWELSGTALAGLTLAVQIGFVVGALGVAITNLADRIPSRRLFTIAAGIGAVTNLGLLVVTADVVWLAIVLRFVTGVALAGVYPSGLKVMAGWFDRGRGMALGVLVGALTLGSATPHLIRGLGAQWQVVVTASSVLTMVSAALMLIAVHDGPHETAASPFSFGYLGRVIRNRGYRLSTFGYLGHMWELYAMWTWTAAFLAASATAAGMSYGSIGVLTFSIIGIGGLGAGLAGVWADRFGRPLIAGGAMAISGVCAVLTPFVFGSHPLVVVPLFMVWGFTVVADSAQFSTMATEESEPQLRGTSLSLQTALGFLLTLVTIRGVPIIAGAAGWRWAFPVLALGPAFGVWAMTAMARHTRQHVV